MKNKFYGKKIVIIGAYGGLGLAYAKGFAAEGAEIFIGGRNIERLKSTAEEIGGNINFAHIDMLDEQSIIAFSEAIRKWNAYVDIIINAAGFDVRKSLKNHSPVEIKNTINTNLTGAIMLARLMLPLLKDEKGSTIVNIGAFGDGGLAFPYHSVDVASRAGLYAFTESMNRELKQQGKNIRIAYFVPNNAATSAEQPYYPIWKEMKLSISSTEKVFKELRKAIIERKPLYQMGFGTSFFSKLNAVSPKFADILLMDSCGRILKKHLSDKTSPL